MKGILLIPIFAAIGISFAMSKTDTTRRGLTPRPVMEALESVSDANESFFVTNGTPFRIARLRLKFVYYYAESGEMLHEEIRDVDCDIPSGETRRLSVRSFDRQRSMYYAGGRAPRRAAPPYRVKNEILSYDVRIVVR